MPSHKAWDPVVESSNSRAEVIPDDSEPKVNPVVMLLRLLGTNIKRYSFSRGRDLNSSDSDSTDSSDRVDFDVDSNISDISDWSDRVDRDVDSGVGDSSDWSDRVDHKNELAQCVVHEKQISKGAMSIRIWDPGTFAD